MDYYERKIRARTYIRLVVKDISSQKELIRKVGDKFGLGKNFVLDYLDELDVDDEITK